MLQHFGSIADLARASVQELSLTRRIVEASKILQLQLIDHVITSSPAPGRNSYALPRYKPRLWPRAEDAAEARVEATEESLALIAGAREQLWQPVCDFRAR
jgi:hypothetical protein